MPSRLSGEPTRDARTQRPRHATSSSRFVQAQISLYDLELSHRRASACTRGLKRLGNHGTLRCQLSRLLGILGVALQLIGPQPLRCRRRRQANRGDPFIAVHVAHVREGADGRDALLVDVAHARGYAVAATANRVLGWKFQRLLCAWLMAMRHRGRSTVAVRNISTSGLGCVMPISENGYHGERQQKDCANRNDQVDPNIPAVSLLRHELLWPTQGG